jgi:hypothetical protein
MVLSYYYGRQQNQGQKSADAAVQYGAHRPMVHIPGFTDGHHGRCFQLKIGGPYEKCHILKLTLDHFYVAQLAQIALNKLPIDFG